MSNTTLIADEAESRRWPFTLMVAGLIGLAGIALIDRVLWPWIEPWFGGTVVSDTTIVESEIDRDRLMVPANHHRFLEQRRARNPGRLDLVALYPRMTGYRLEDAPHFEDTSATSRLVFVSILPREGTPDPAFRVATIYQRFFIGAPVEGPGGLTGRRLAEGSGHEDEVIYFQGGAVRPFTARCFVDKAEMTAPTCIAEFHAGRDLTVIYRFRETYLGEWQRLDGSVREMVARFLAN